MEEKKVVLLRLYGGEILIGEVVEPVRPDSILANIVLENPRMVHMVPTVDGVGMVVRPVCDPFVSDRLRKRIVVNAAHVMFHLDEEELEKELLNGYRSEVLGIKLASPEEAAALASAGSFELYGRFRHVNSMPRRRRGIFSLQRPGLPGMESPTEALNSVSVTSRCSVGTKSSFLKMRFLISSMFRAAWWRSTTWSCPPSSTRQAVPQLACKLPREELLALAR